MVFESDGGQVTGIDICPIFVQQNDRPDNFMPEVGRCFIVEERTGQYQPNAQDVMK